MLLETKNVSKSFGGIYALRDICFSLREGEVHGLVGENGAGKSTLIKLLTGVYQMEEGSISFGGSPYLPRTPAAARRAGISVIHQDRTLVPTFTAVENAYLGLPYPRKGAFVDWKSMEKKVQAVSQDAGIELDLHMTAARMSPPQRTCLEIVRALMHDCRLLILDEPTASLTERESETLFEIIGRLKSRGTAILYVSHRLDEIFRLTDRVTVLKNGTLVKTLETASATREDLIRLMADHYTAGGLARAKNTGDELLSCSHLKSRDGTVLDASLSLHAGEILGIFGLGGSGRTELLETLYGLRSADGGEIRLMGEVQPRLSPARSLSRGMALISEDRRGKGMIGNLSVRENVSLSALQDVSRRGIVRKKQETQAVHSMTERLQVRMAGQEQRVLELSGGNQQKVVFARTLLTRPRIFLCDEPTQAVDVMTRSEIHRLLRAEADRGCGVLFVSSDLKEVLEVADRVQIMASGRTWEVLENQDLTTRQVLDLCYREARAKVKSANS
ncbi:MAG: sugar ABC transporter ATP-binding protein [Clostridia bacterium]|nr:sugar ABC transporter ATP-binding protein [Clostridia bacterium]